jgi:hypothetical protein
MHIPLYTIGACIHQNKQMKSIRRGGSPTLINHDLTNCHLRCQYKLSWLNLNPASRVCIAWSKSYGCIFDFVASHQTYDSLRVHLILHSSSERLGEFRGSCYVSKILLNWQVASNSCRVLTYGCLAGSPLLIFIPEYTTNHVCY